MATKYRICFREYCFNHISFNAIRSCNPDWEEEHLKKLWEDDRVQFYCCKCFKDLRTLEEENELKNFKVFSSWDYLPFSLS